MYNIETFTKMQQVWKICVSFAVKYTTIEPQPSVVLTQSPLTIIQVNVHLKALITVHIYMDSYSINNGQLIFKGLGSQTGFFCPVNCPKVKHNFQSYQLFFLLYEYMCVSNKQKDRPQKEWRGLLWHQIYGGLSQNWRFLPKIAPNIAVFIKFNIECTLATRPFFYRLCILPPITIWQNIFPWQTCLHILP